jgi:hypothetical protein
MVEKVRTRENQRPTGNFQKYILDIISQNDVEDESTSCSRVSYIATRKGYRFLFSRIETIATEDSSSRKILFLLAPFLEKTIG